MELNSYIDIISLRLAILSNEVKLKSAVNLLDSNVLSEDVFKTILNTIYGWDLQNANVAEQNIKAIDLVDNTAKIFVQVSSDNSKAKVQSSLNKIELPKYSGYTFKFVCISKGISNLKKSTFDVPDGISFNVDADSYDDKRLLRDVMAKDIDTIAKLASFLEKSILPSTAEERRPSVITYVINCLSEECLAEVSVNPDVKPFDFIPKIDLNKLVKWKAIVTEYAVYSVLVDKIYKQYDKLGVNKSLAVLASLHDLYLNLSLESSGDDLFDKLLEKVYEIVDGDGTCNESLTREELMMNIKIVLVDAFVKCKIFEKPE
jgi:hypothetical protein